MARNTWRRHHGPHLVATIIEDDSTSFRVSVWRDPAGPVRSLPRAFARLESAQAAGDDLLRRTFLHVCTRELCGDWLVWT